MKNNNIYIIIAFMLTVNSVSICQETAAFQINKIHFTIDTLSIHNVNWLDSAITLSPKIPVMSFSNGNPPINPYQNPFGPSAIQFWYFYLPYSDTLTILMSNSISGIDSEPKRLYLQKGKYVMKIDSHNADLIKVTSIYSLSIKFCNSTYKRNFIVLK